MIDDQFADLKQFISTTVSQTEVRLQMQISRLQTDVRQLQVDVADLRSDMASGFEGVGDAIEQIHQQSEAQEATIDRRFTRLEQQLA